MENQMISSLTTIQQNMSVLSIQTDGHKFQKVFQEEAESDVVLNYSIIYKAALDGCQELNQKVLQVQKYQKYFNSGSKFAGMNQIGIEEPQKLQVKIYPKIQSSHSQFLNRSKSEKITFVRKGRYSEGTRSKALTATRFSNKSNHIKSQIWPFVFQKDKKSSHKKNQVGDLNLFNAGNQKFLKKSIQKKVRLKTNSLISFPGQISEQIERNRCIPLVRIKAEDEEEESFLQNAYRLRKGQVSVWHELSKMWRDAQNKKKGDENKISLTPKEIKKVIYEGYDFNGQLIPSANAGLKHKKYIQEGQQIDVELINQENIQNLNKYHDRQQRNAKTYKQIKINPFQSNNQESEFLVNLERLNWNRHISHLRHQQIEQDEKKTKKLIKFEQNKGKKVNPKVFSSNNQNFTQRNIVIEHEELVEEFQKVKFGSFQSQVDQTKHFPFGLQKYVKIKKFQQKLTKSKSYNCRSVNYFSIPYHHSQSEIQANLRRKQPQSKGSQKVRANKRLFKDIFNTSLKRIDPENRQDIITVKLLQNNQNKENAQDSEKAIQSRPLRKNLARNSDTLLLKKGFSIKPSLFKKIKESQTPSEIDTINGIQDSSLSKSKFEDVGKQNLPEETKNNEEKSIQQFPLASNSSKINHRKSMAFPHDSGKIQNLQKLFKKQTKKTLIKQSAYENRRQSFF